MLFRKFKISLSIKNFYIVSSLFLVVYFAEAQVETTIDSVVGSITEHDLKNYLAIIAHDTLEGRETGQDGQRKAAHYLQIQFEKIGLNPVNIRGQKTYFQAFQLYTKKLGEVSITVDGIKFKNMRELLYLRNAPGKVNKNIEVVFVGYGNEKDYIKLDHKNRGVVIFNPGDDWEDKAAIAREAGAEYIFITYGNADEDIEHLIGLYKSYYRSSSLNLERTPSSHEENIFFISPGLAEKIFSTNLQTMKAAADRSLKGKYRSLKKLHASEFLCTIECMEEEIDTENVIGFVEGMVNPEEVVIISAHYDHLGMNGVEIYNGADDNGSGTVAILELAEAFTLAKKRGIGPKRSVLFILMTGEEKGLLGSTYYVKHPVFPLDKTIANFNIDMIGRIDEIHADNPDYVYLIGSDKISLDLHNISEKTNDEFIGLLLDYKYNAEDDPERFYYRSDHYNFAENGIPVIFYFTGVHEDYHRPTDVIDKIQFDRMERITKLIFYTSWNVANMEGKLSRK